MMVIRILLPLASVILAVSLAGGCSSAQTQSPPIPSTNPTQTASSAQPPAGESENTDDQGLAETGSGEPTNPDSQTAAEESPAEDPRAAQGDAGAPKPTTESTPSTSPGARSREERTGELDRKLAASLRELDGLLMEEQEMLAEQAAAGGSPSSGGTSGGIRYGSGNTGNSGSSGGVEGGSSGGAVGGGGVGGGDAGAPVPDDIGDGSDDDIVARQIREAAIAEDDPELREKLWQEYRDYKASLNGRSGSSTGEN